MLWPKNGRSLDAALISKEVRPILTTQLFAGSSRRPGIVTLSCLLNVVLIGSGPASASPKAVKRTPRQQKQMTSSTSSPVINPAALVSLARARQLMKQGVDNLAEPELKNAATLAPDWLEAQRELARWYTRHQRWAEASNAWRSVLLINRTDAEAIKAAEEARRNTPNAFVPGNIVNLGISSDNPLGGQSGRTTTRGVATTQPRLAQGNPAPSSAPTTSVGGSSSSPSAGSGGAASGGAAGGATTGSAPGGGNTGPKTPSGTATPTTSVRTTIQNTVPVATGGNPRRNQQGSRQTGTTKVGTTKANTTPKATTNTKTPPGTRTTPNSQVTSNVKSGATAGTNTANTTKVNTDKAGNNKASNTPANAMGTTGVTSATGVTTAATPKAIANKPTRTTGATSKATGTPSKATGAASRTTGAATRAAVAPRVIKPVSKKRQAAAWPFVERATRALGNNPGAALSLYQRAYDLDPNNPFAQRGIAESLFVLKRWGPATDAFRLYLAANPNDQKGFRQKSLRSLGDALTAQKRYPEAVPVYRQALALNPKDAPAAFQLAQVLTWMQQHKAADTYYRQALTVEPKNPVAWTAYGEALALGNNVRARDAFLRALKLTQGKRNFRAVHTRASLGLANFYSWKGQYDQAVAPYQTVLASDPKNVPVRMSLADALTFSGQAAQAIPHYETVLRANSNSRQAELGLGRALVLAGRYQEGLPHLNLILQQDPNNVDALRMVALAESNIETAAPPTGTQSRALAAYERLLAAEKEPADQAQALSSIGRLRARGGDFTGSLDAYSKAHQLVPENNDISLDYARVLIMQQQLKEANPLIKDVLSRDANNVRARIMQIAVENGLGYRDRAVRLVSELENLNVTNPNDAFELATALNGAGNPEAARRVLQRFAKQVPEDPAMALRVANAIRDAGDYETADTVYKTLIQRNPNNLEARINYATMLTWSRQFEAAQTELNYVLERDKNNLTAQELLTRVQINLPGGQPNAVKVASELLKADPTNVTANMTMAQANMGDKKFDEAAANYRAALTKEPGNAEAQLGLARSLYYGRQVEPAISEYQKLIRLTPNDNRVKLELAKVYVDRNRLPEAEVLYNQVLESQRGSLLPPTAQFLGRPRTRSNARLSPWLMQALELQPTAADGEKVTLPRARIFLTQAEANAAAGGTTTGGTTTGGTSGATDAAGGTTAAANGTNGAGTTPANGNGAGATNGATPNGTNGAAAITPEAAAADQVSALRGLGEVRRLQQRYQEAVDYFRQALKIDENDVGSRVGLAQSIRAQGDFATSLTEVNRALETSPTNLQARVLHAQLMGDTGKPAEAQAELDKLVTDLQEATNVPVETYLTLAQSFNNLRNYDASLQLLGLARQTFPDQPIVSRTTAETLTFARRWDDAVTEYNKLLEANPNDVDATLGKARVYNYSNRLEQAEPVYRQVLQLEPNNYQGLIELADILARRGNWTEASARYREAIDKNPNDLGVRVELARTLRFNRQYAPAETELNKIIEMDARYAPAYTERGILRGQQGNYEPAIADLKQALSITPTDLNAQFGLAEVQGYAGNYEESIQTYQAALQRDPKNEKGRVELGLVMAYARRYKDAINEFNTVLAQNPQNVNAQIGKADALARSGDVPAAVNIYNAVLQATPENRRARLGLADAFVYGRQYDRALAEYDTLIRAEPENVSYRIARARTLGFAGRNAQAVAQLRPIVAGNPNNLEARLAMAEAMTNSTDPDLQAQAVPQYNTILTAQPNNITARLGLGRAYSYTGRYGMAVNEFNRILRTQPRNQEALFALAETQRFAGDPFAAQAAYQRVLAVDPNNVPAQTGLGLVRRLTAPSVTAYTRQYNDTNGVRLNVYGAGATYRSRPLTVGLTGETGRYRDDGVSFPRRAVNLLLGRNFGNMQARLLLNRVRYSGAPSRNLYDLLVERPTRQRKRYYVNVARRENLESRQALTQAITMQETGAGFQYPLAERIDLTADIARIRYSDANTRTNFSTSLMYRLKAVDPTFRLGVGYRREDTQFLRTIYYTPQDFSSFNALADYIYDRNELRFGIFAAYPLSSSSGNGGINRPAKTLFGYVNYDVSDPLSVFLQGGIVRAPNFRSNDISGGVNLRW